MCKILHINIIKETTEDTYIHVVKQKRTPPSIQYCNHSLSSPSSGVHTAFVALYTGYTHPTRVTDSSVNIYDAMFVGMNTTEHIDATAKIACAFISTPRLGSMNEYERDTAARTTAEHPTVSQILLSPLIIAN